MLILEKVNGISMNYTAFTIWAGFILLICDIPYHEKGIYQYLLRTSRSSWLYGQLLYLVIITVLYFLYLFFLIFLMIMPQVTIKLKWTKPFFQMVNLPMKYGIKNWFVFPVSIMRGQTPGILFGKCVVLNFLAGILTGFLTIFKDSWLRKHREEESRKVLAWYATAIGNCPSNHGTSEVNCVGRTNEWTR